MFLMTIKGGLQIIMQKMLLACLFMFLHLKYIDAIGAVPPEQINSSFQIKIENGFIQGSQETTVNGKTYFRYVGIPYARPPIKDLRFRSPKSMPKWNGVLDATMAGPCCAGINITGLSRFDISTMGEEDCLYLNVFTSKKPSTGFNETPLPVMMYIFGGAFFSGCNNNYEPDFFIENDVILVEPNYRLAVFGYLSTEDMECSGNWAIKDIIAALKWIQVNIGQFGGNPNNVTIFGQSAGAANINAIILSPKAQGLFHKAILMSGSSLSFWAYQTEQRKVAFDVGIALGIETNNTKSLLNELRKVDGRDLLKAQIPVIIKNMLTVATKGLPFTPTVEPHHNDAVLSLDYPFNNLEKGEFNRVPIMAGVTSMEMLLFKPAFNILKPFISILDMSPGLMIRITQDIQNKTIVGNKIKNFYFSTNSFAGATEEELLKLLSEEAYLRPMRKMASLLAKYCPVYFYQFSYEGQLGLDYSSRFNGITKRTKKGVGHIEDLAYLFHDDDIRNTADMQMTKKLTKMFTNFAKSGNPTPYRDPLLDNVTWPTVSEDSFPYLNIGEDLNVIKNNFDQENFKFWEHLLKTYGQKPYKVY